MDLAIDGLRVLHMLSFAIGIGSAAFLEVLVVRRFLRGIDIEGLRIVLAGHDIVKYALAGLWVSGLGLLYYKIYVLCLPFSPKLGAKLVVVTLLTINMGLIDRILIPDLFEYEGSKVRDIPASDLRLFGGIAGFSAGCWIAALLLGGISRMRYMSPVELGGILLPILAAATLAGVVLALAASGRRSSRTDISPAVVPGE